MRSKFSFLGTNFLFWERNFIFGDEISFFGIEIGILEKWWNWNKKFVTISESKFRHWRRIEISSLTQNPNFVIFWKQKIRYKLKTSFQKLKISSTKMKNRFENKTIASKNTKFRSPKIPKFERAKKRATISLKFRF